MYVNTNINNRGCQGRCLCIADAAPSCPNGDGTVANIDDCACGLKKCEPGQYCLSVSSQCVTNPICNNTDGTVANTGNCTCGTTDCTSENGLFCDADNNQCSATLQPPQPSDCTITDGTAANEEACTCGTTDCTSSTGLFCSSRINTCSDSNVFTMYSVVTSGTCASNGYGLIDDTATCEAAAEARSWSDWSATVLTSSYRPNGCYGFANTARLYLNPYATSEDPCTSYRYCLCATTLPVCTNTDASVATDTDCICGDTTCASGTRCDVVNNKCVTPPPVQLCGGVVCENGGTCVDGA